MRVNFPNTSRSFDNDKCRVRFWGYDQAIEISFYVECDALKQLCPKMDIAEKGFLAAFDKMLNRIHEVANKVYIKGSGGKGTYAYVLSADDF